METQDITGLPVGLVNWWPMTPQRKGSTELQYSVLVRSSWCSLVAQLHEKIPSMDRTQGVVFYLVSIS